MGHRANFVLIDGGAAEAFKDSWAALDCILGLKEGARRLKKLVPELYERTDELMDWGFAEGGYLIDYDENVLIAFGSPDVDLDEMPDDYREEAGPILEAFRGGWASFVRQVERGWRGFTMIWDDRGVDAFAAHLERRDITSIKTAKPCHPASTCEPEVVVVPGATTKTAYRANAKLPASARKAPRKTPRG